MKAFFVLIGVALLLGAGLVFTVDELNTTDAEQPVLEHYKLLTIEEQRDAKEIFTKKLTDEKIISLAKQNNPIAIAIVQQRPDLRKKIISEALHG